MTWIIYEWVALLLGIGIIALHLFGHKRHGGQGRGQRHAKGNAAHNKRAGSRSWRGKHPLQTVVLIGLALWVDLVGPAQAQDPDNYQIVGSVAAYLGVIPAEIVGGHPPDHPETRMHGGPPDSAHTEHVVIALFEDPSGARIEDAQIEATIEGLGHLAITPLALDAMSIAGVITYGGYISFPGRNIYTIELLISRPGIPAVTKMRFGYQHGGD